MEPATAKSPSPASAFPIEKVRAAFPALEREVNGKPVAYLDSGASSQRVLASIQAVDRYERRHHSNVHRGSHTLSAEATDAYEGARATVADHIGAADRREVLFVRNATEAINLVARAWGDANVGAGDRILLTEMEHHSNIVPWQQLAERVGAEIDWAPIDDEGLLDMEAFAALLERGPKLVAVDPRLQRARDREPAGGDLAAGPRRRAPWSSPTAPRRRRSCRSTSPRWASTSTRSPATSSTAPTGIGALWGRLELLRAMPPFLGGGSMIRKVTREGTTYADVPARFEAGTPAIAQAIGMASALRWLDGARAWRRCASTSAQIADYALERLAEVPGLQVFGPPRGPERLGPVSFELEGIHAHDVSEILDRHGVAVRAGHHCAQILMDRLGVAATARASFGVYTTPRGDRPPGRRPRRRPPRLRPLASRSSAPAIWRPCTCRAWRPSRSRQPEESFLPTGIAHLPLSSLVSLPSCFFLPLASRYIFTLRLPRQPLRGEDSLPWKAGNLRLTAIFVEFLPAPEADAARQQCGGKSDGENSEQHAAGHGHATSQSKFAAPL